MTNIIKIKEAKYIERLYCDFCGCGDLVTRMLATKWICRYCEEQHHAEIRRQLTAKQARKDKVNKFLST